MIERPKIKIYDIYLRRKFYRFFSAVSLILGFFLYFKDIPTHFENKAIIVFFFFLVMSYLYIWYKANKLKEISIKVDATDVIIKEGDLFEEDGLIAVGFNEYFDTIVDNKIISERSLNGVFIQKILHDEVEPIDSFIENNIESSQKLELVSRARGKTQKFIIGTVCLYEEKYILTAFAKFNDKNEARLTMPEYLEFLINFWDQVNSIYATRSVSVPIFGGGITRIKEHKSIPDEQLLKIMLWTFKISEMRFKHPAKLTIVVHPDKMKAINLHDIEGLSNGL